MARKIREDLVWLTLTLVRTRWRGEAVRVWFGKNTDFGQDKMARTVGKGLVWQTLTLVRPKMARKVGEGLVW